MKKILVQEKLTLANAIILSVIVVIVGLAFVFIAMTNDSISLHTRSNCFAMISVIAVFIPLWLRNARSKTAYVSELMITDEDLILVYKVDKDIKEKKAIKLADISSVHAKLNANYARAGRSVTLFCETKVTIKTINKSVISFTEVPTASWSFCNYAFLLRLLGVAALLPNFTYKVVGNSELAKEDVKYFAQHGKRLPFIKRLILESKIFPVWTRILLCICFAMICGCMGLFLYLSIPPFLSSEDIVYKNYVDSGYEYYTTNQYDKSLLEYDNALNIHSDDPVLYYYRALAYKYKLQYDKAVIEAQKGIENLNNRSVYYKAKNYKFMGNSEVGLYTVLGECEYYLENYGKAIEAFNYIAEKSQYKYSDVYLWRGCCYARNGEPRKALEDFYKHKEVILNYMDEQANSEDPDLYPRYAAKDLKQINQWISNYK